VPRIWRKGLRAGRLAWGKGGVVVKGVEGGSRRMGRAASKSPADEAWPAREEGTLKLEDPQC